MEETIEDMIFNGLFGGDSLTTLEDTAIKILAAKIQTIIDNQILFAVEGANQAIQDAKKSMALSKEELVKLTTDSYTRGYAEGTADSTKHIIKALNALESTGLVTNVTIPQVIEMLRDIKQLVDDEAKKI